MFLLGRKHVLLRVIYSSTSGLYFQKYNTKFSAETIRLLDSLLLSIEQHFTNTKLFVGFVHMFSAQIFCDRTVTMLSDTAFIS